MTGTRINRAVVLAQRPRGLPDDSTWRVEERPIAALERGQVLVAVRECSLDPAMRGWLDDRPSYLPPVGIDEVMRAMVVGEVVESQVNSLPVGTWVLGALGVQEYAVASAGALTRIDADLGTPSEYLGVLGTTGLTAYFGLFEHGRPRAGDTVVVSAAAGGVGSIVGQLARLSGARVVGIAGGPEKCAYLTEALGFDASIDYREGDVRRALRKACPAGIDVYFDNVGGQILDDALANLAMGARVVICGAISQYNINPDHAAGGQPSGPANYLSLLVRRGTMSGFLVFDYADRYAIARQRLSAWVKSGEIVARQTVVSGGVEDFPATLLALFSGDNWGKLSLRLDVTGAAVTGAGPR
jgi:NADPH-dependent curcumin reductase CurA